ncbi:hypothetical protein [Hyphomicrobium sp. ghe19]|uniref:hypothetical protein n=1 Tax=Hyphomicrobium sp. ghe19 TaxID=2682968 RepID=UPI0013677EDD|nr:hypothetical protein HYPP_02400 [Hyphomicrobium sp. ghe19]
MKVSLHTLELWLHHETYPGDPESGALKVSEDGADDQAVWLPKSQCQVESRRGQIVLVTAPERLLTEKGLV